MSSDLPPSLRPRSYPSTRAGAIAKVRDVLVELSSPGDSRDFLLIYVDQDGYSGAHGIYDLTTLRLMAGNACDILKRAAQVSEPAVARAAAAASAALGIDHSDVIHHIRRAEPEA
jgi:hypothetical protein